MSLFDNDQYRYRETFFVLFNHQDRPSMAALTHELSQLNGRYQIEAGLETDEGWAESLTVLSPDDFAAMDICYLQGEDVSEQLAEFQVDLVEQDLTPDQRDKQKLLPHCDARFEIYHFERVADVFDQAEEEFLDPGTLLVVLQRLAQLCHGVGIDPQSGTIV